jgi:hypothetical protein
MYHSCGRLCPTRVTGCPHLLDPLRGDSVDLHRQDLVPVDTGKASGREGVDELWGDNVDLPRQQLVIVEGEAQRPHALDPLAADAVDPHGQELVEVSPLDARRCELAGVLRCHAMDPDSDEGVAVEVVSVAEGNELLDPAARHVDGGDHQLLLGVKAGDPVALEVAEERLVRREGEASAREREAPCLAHDLEAAEGRRGLHRLGGRQCEIHGHVAMAPVDTQPQLRAVTLTLVLPAAADRSPRDRLGPTALLAGRSHRRSSVESPRQCGSG